jgi:hypothetical protein
MKTTSHRRLSLVLSLFIAGTANSNDVWWTANPDISNQLVHILGSSPAGWQITPNTGAVAKVDGRTVLATGANTITLVGGTTYGSNVEYTLTFRIADDTKPGGASMFIGVKEPAKYLEAPGAAVLTAPNVTYVSWYIYGGSNGAYRTYSSYNLKAVTTRSLTWPETLRKSVEQDLASLPGVDEKWLTFRYVVRDQLVETYLDDRLLDVRNEPKVDVNGRVYITLQPNTCLASFRARSIPPADPVFRPIALAGYVNASTINGARVQRDSLPTSTAEVRKIPFAFPTPDERGNDHISLAKSWAQFGAMEGYVESHYGDFGGRWTDALKVNPARIQLRIANDRYNKLHIIAAADDSKNSVPVVSAQFFRQSAGFPKSFSGRVPSFTAKSSEATPLPVNLDNGRAGNLWLVTIPLDPGQLSTFSDLDVVEVELTKEVHQFRAYPDPICYSFHQGGLPSSVHIYALTLERPPVRMDVQPDKFGHVWTAPAKPSYTVKLQNHTTAARNVEVEISTLSHDGNSTTKATQKVAVPPGAKDLPVKFALHELKKYGHHTVSVTMKDGDQTWTEHRSLAWLHPETREKGGWEDGRGPLLGYWAWGGAHYTPPQLDEMAVMAEAGAETCLGDLGGKHVPAEVKALAEKNGMITSLKFGSHVMYYAAFSGAPLQDKYDPKNPEATAAAFVEEIKKIEVAPSAITRPIEVPIFPEPSIGPISHGNYPEYYGDPEYKLTPDEERSFKAQLEKFLIVGKAIRKNWPNAKILLPWGDPLYVVPFLRYSAEARELIDGTALDMPGFERMPEQQLHQICHHRLHQLKEEYRKVGKTPFLAVHEGTCAPTPPGALDFDTQADIYTRNFLIYFAYGVYRHPSGPTPFDCGNYWGEEHYGCCGLFERIPYCTPKPSYVAYATLSRHLNRANCEKWLPTGTLSVYALQFKHYKTGKLVHVFWTIRGKRAVTLAVPAGAKISRWDEDDNETVLAEKDGKVTFTIDSSPCYIEGLTADAQIALGEPDHGDSLPGKDAAKLANLGDGSWKLVAAEDKDYADSYPVQIARFLGKMSVSVADAPKEQGNKALAVRLEKQDKERKVMPWYTTLVPKKPVVIPGKSSHIGLWVKAASDWGRVVYVLRDANDEKWVSVGTKEQWNCDDTHQWSVFNFDGWRYLRFEMPSNLPYDSFRELGSTWWGHYGKGDGIIDLPLSLEKIIVERRTHVIHVNDPQPAKPDDVLLGDLYAEYASPSDKTDEVVRHSRIRMPAPEGVPALGNPIKELAAKGVGEPVTVTRVEPPAHGYDGTRCLVFFDKVPTAASYNVWVSPYADGSGALELGKGWKEPGQLLTGLRPEVDFYVFVVYADKDGNVSKPSKPLKIRLKDMFGHK